MKSTVALAAYLAAETVENGGEISAAEETAIRVCKSCGAKNINVFIIPYSGEFIKTILIWASLRSLIMLLESFAETKAAISKLIIHILLKSVLVQPQLPWVHFAFISADLLQMPLLRQ